VAKNKADTRATLIEPKLKEVGCSDLQIMREYYYQRVLNYFGGRSYKSWQSSQTDYLLWLSDEFPIAVVEAKAEGEVLRQTLNKQRDMLKTLGSRFLILQMVMR
jgi:type I restriction enzyme R subunit